MTSTWFVAVKSIIHYRLKQHIVFVDVNYCGNPYPMLRIGTVVSVFVRWHPSYFLWGVYHWRIMVGTIFTSNIVTVCLVASTRQQHWWQRQRGSECCSNQVIEVGEDWLRRLGRGRSAPDYFLNFWKKVVFRHSLIQTHQPTGVYNDNKLRREPHWWP